MVWYHAASEKPRMEQIVLSPGAMQFKESDRMLMLAARYLRLYQNPWISVILRLDTAEHTALVIKANGSTGFLKAFPFKIAFSFIKGHTGNLFAIFVEFDSPAPPRCPSAPLVVFEDIMGLDYEENRELLKKHLDTEELDIWLAEGGIASVDDDIIAAEPIEVKYETTIAIEPACHTKLRELVVEHLDEHIGIGPQRWDFRRSFQVFGEDMPATRSPVLDAPSKLGYGHARFENQVVKNATSDGNDQGSAGWFWDVFGRFSRESRARRRARSAAMDIAYAFVMTTDAEPSIAPSTLASNVPQVSQAADALYVVPLMQIAFRLYPDIEFEGTNCRFGGWYGITDDKSYDPNKQREFLEWARVVFRDNEIKDPRKYEMEIRCSQEGPKRAAVALVRKIGRVRGDKKW